MKYSIARYLINIISLVILNGGVVPFLADAAVSQHEESLSILKQLIEEITNPSGGGTTTTCDADSATLEELSSGRDFVIFSDQVYVPDCNLPCHLTKPYWKVLAYLNDDEGVSAHIVPRPDDYGVKYGFCDDGDTIDDRNNSSSSSASSSRTSGGDQLQQYYYKELFQNYTMCNDRDGGADPDVINNMKLSDALLITNLLHRHLQFQMVNYGDDSWSIEPYAYEDDILLACDVLELEGGTAYDQVEGYCDDVRNRCTNDGACSDIGIIPSKENLDIVVPTINALYGIDGGSSAISHNTTTDGGCSSFLHNTTSSQQAPSQGSTDSSSRTSGSYNGREGGTMSKDLQLTLVLLLALLLLQ